MTEPDLFPTCDVCEEPVLPLEQRDAEEVDVGGDVDTACYTCAGEA